jgi:hypothetical protein
MPGERMMIGPRRTRRSVRAIPAPRTRRDRTTSGPADAAFQMSGVQDAVTQHGKRRRSDRGSMARLLLAVESVGDLGETRGVPCYRDTRQHVAQRRIARGRGDRRPRGRDHGSTRVRALTSPAAIKRGDRCSVSPRFHAAGARASGTGDEAVRRRRLAPVSRAAETAVRPLSFRRRA